MRSRVQSLYCEKSVAIKRQVAADSPRGAEKSDHYNSSIRRVSYGNMEHPQSVCVTTTKSDSDDSGCEANFEV